jgi:hypothetical protein
MRLTGVGARQWLSTAPDSRSTALNKALAINVPAHARSGVKPYVETLMADQPIICSLTPEALDARKRDLFSALLDRSAGRELLADGVRLRFEPSSEMLSSIVQAVDAERHCCRFLRFTITVEPNDGAMILELTGPPGTREFVAALLEL